MRTYWELKGNIVGTRENRKKNSSSQPPPPLPVAQLKRKNARHLECVLGPSQSLHETSLPKRVHHHFWPNLYPSQVQLFLVEFDWPITKRKVKTMQAPQNRISYGKMECLPFGPYI
jgi:hypothetical protein